MPHNARRRADEDRINGRSAEDADQQVDRLPAAVGTANGRGSTHIWPCRLRSSRRRCAMVTKGCQGNPRTRPRSRGRGTVRFHTQVGWEALSTFTAARCGAVRRRLPARASGPRLNPLHRRSAPASRGGNCHGNAFHPATPAPPTPASHQRAAPTSKSLPAVSMLARKSCQPRTHELDQRAAAPLPPQHTTL